MVGVRHTVGEAFLNVYQAAILLNPACSYSDADKRLLPFKGVWPPVRLRFRYNGYNKSPRPRRPLSPPGSHQPGLRDLRQAVETREYPGRDTPDGG